MATIRERRPGVWEVRGYTGLGPDSGSVADVGLGVSDAGQPSCRSSAVESRSA